MSILSYFVGLDYHQPPLQVCVRDREGNVLSNLKAPNGCGRDAYHVWNAVPYSAHISLAINACTGAAKFSEELVRQTGWSVDLAHAGYFAKLKRCRPIQPTSAILVHTEDRQPPRNQSSPFLRNNCSNQPQCRTPNLEPRLPKQYDNFRHKNHEKLTKEQQQWKNGQSESLRQSMPGWGCIWMSRKNWASPPCRCMLRIKPPGPSRPRGIFWASVTMRGSRSLPSSAGLRAKATPTSRPSARSGLVPEETRAARVQEMKEISDFAKAAGLRYRRPAHRLRAGI